VRKLVVFLLLLGAGLYLLYWLDRRAQEGVVGAPPEEQPPALPPDQPGGLQPGGPTQFTYYDRATKRPLYKLRSADTQSSGGHDELTDVTLELFDPTVDERLELRVTAARARARRASSGGLAPTWEDRYELEDVRAEILGGFPLAPLELRAASAVLAGLAEPATRTVATEQPFSAHSPELVLSGTGFTWRVAAQELVIPRAGRAELLRAGSEPARLAAGPEGSLRLSRAAQDGPVTLAATGGAVLEPGAENPGRLAAESLELYARAIDEGGGGRRLALERLNARGAVDWTSGEARFQGERLVATFQPSGRLDHARLDGAPRAELTLVLSGAGPTPEEPAEERRVVLEGQEALDITWRDGGYALHVERASDAAGGATRVPTIVTRDFRLESAASIDGWWSEDQRRARFEARGGVVAKSGEAELETAAFLLELAPDASGETLLRGTASGGARLTGRLPAEPDEDAPPRPFALTSPDGLTLERSARGWRVVESTRVAVTLEGPQGFHAQADRVHDFVVPHSGAGELAREGLRFAAEGAIAIDLEGGRLGGESLEVLSVAPVPHFVVRGTPESKAFLRWHDYGEASALEVERTGETLHARGAVTGSAVVRAGAEGEDVRTTFSGDELVLDRNEGPELLPGERLRTLRAVVSGNVQGSVTAGGDTLVMKSQRFSAENRARIVAGADAPLELGSLFIAEGAVHVDSVSEEGELALDCERFEVERTARDVERGFRQLTANGAVRFEGRFGGDAPRVLGGECEIFVLDAGRSGSLEAGPNGRVLLHATDPERKAPYRLTAERVDFELDEEQRLRLLAQRPEVRMLGLRARAEHFTADDQSGVTLSGSVRLTGATAAQVPFTLDAEEVLLVGRRPAEGEEAAAEDQLDALFARSGVDFRLSDTLRARGERLSVRRSTGILRLEGAPATFEMGATRLETEWVEFDPVLQVLVATGRGRMIAQEEPVAGASEASDSWALSFLSASTLLELDSVVLVVQEPVFHATQFESALRASWAIFWLNRAAFQDSDRRDELFEGLRRTLQSLDRVREKANLGDVLGLFESEELAGLLREVYFEGPVEVLADGELLARADALYLDAASRHGWMAGATVHLGGQFLGQRQEKLIIKADWLRISSDATLRADQATVTSCTFDDPHVRVVTGDLSIDPASEPGEARYQVRLEDNRVELYDALRIPLPTIDFATDEEFKPLLPTLSLADSARFGTLFSFAFTRPADNVGELFDSLARPDGDEEPESADAPADAAPEAPASPPKPRSKVDAHYKVDGSYLGSRGALLDLGLEIEAKEDYWFDLFLGLALDDGDDRGFVRVDEDDRSSLRRWLRSQAYFDHGKSSWSFSFSEQSDAAVQSEFFEGRFLRYERAENYVQWRRSTNEYFLQGSAKVRVDDFRTDVEELPALSAYRGRAPLLRLGSLALLHTGDVRAEYLRRRSGSEPRSPFELPPTFEGGGPGFGLPDGLGEREVLRVDTSQTLELPVALGAGWKLTPFVSGEASAWSEGVDESDQPTRVIAEGGARLAASFWKRAGRYLHRIAPFVEYRAELEREDEDGTPVVFDALERRLSGDFLRFGARGRFFGGGEESLLDLDLVGTHAAARSDGESDGWLPLEVFGRLLLAPYGHEFEVFHDARYDLEEHRTTYSVVSLGTHFGEEWGVQFSHQRGLGVDEQPFFEAASVSGLYRWTEKWEFEARESFSLLEDEELDTKLVLRRYGHDLVFELESAVREGEGSSFGVSVKPRFGYRPPRVGYVPW
jgi:hypothetical protein